MTSAGIAPAVAAPGSDDKVPRGLERRENVVTAGAAVAVAFPHRRAVVGVGPGFGYERALSRVVSIEVGGALAVAPRSRTVGGSAGLPVPFYLIGDAPSGFFLAPGLAMAVGDRAIRGSADPIGPSTSSRTMVQSSSRSLSPSASIGTEVNRHACT